MNLKSEAANAKNKKKTCRLRLSTAPSAFFRGLARLDGGEGERLMEMKERRRREGGGRAADGGAAGMNGSPAGSAGGAV